MRFDFEKFIDFLLKLIVTAEKFDERLYRTYLWLQLKVNRFWNSIFWTGAAVVALVAATSKFYDLSVSRIPVDSVAYMWGGAVGFSLLLILILCIRFCRLALEPQRNVDVLDTSD